MSYVPIILRKLKYTYKGNDYDLSPVQLPYLSSIYGTDAGTPKNFLEWIADPSNAESTQTFSFTGADNSADGIINKARIKAAFNASALNVQPIFAALSVNEELYFWNENVGRNVRWVWKKESSTLWRTGVYVYGTYTWGNTLAGDTTSYGWKEPAVQNVGFLHDSDNGRFHWFSCTFSSNDAEHGYTSEPVYFNEDSDYYWSAYGAALTMLCTGNWIEPTVNNDPYAGTGEAAEDQLQTGEATGDGDDTSDVISVPSKPTLNLSACQMIMVYVPDLTGVQNVASYLWTNFDIHDVNNSLSKVFTDPSQCILSLHVLPFTPTSSTPITVTFGGFASSVSLPPATEQYHDVDCGSLSFSEYWGNYLDYNPYTRITCCLPFVGQVDLDPDEVMNKTVKVKYRVDVITGSFVCFLYVDGDKVLGQYAGNMAQQVPITSADYSRLNAAILGVAATAATGFGIAAAGGFSTPQTTSDGGLTIQGGGLNAGALGHFAGSVIGSGVDNVLNAKVRVAHSGGVSGTPGIMGIMKPYCIIHRARQSVPADANKFKGYPCNAKFTLSDLEGCGFTTVRSIKLDNFIFTETEAEELRQILAAGVYL
jgi:hypothetical protein